MPLHNLAKMTTATTGTGTITLGSAVSGFNSFAGAGVVDGETVTYSIRDGANSEAGVGVYTSSGTTLTRATIFSSTNGGSAINLSGSAQVMITPVAEELFLARENLILNGDFQLNQREYAGTVLSANAYCYDRWKDSSAGTAQISSVSSYTVTLDAGELEQKIELGAWGYSNLASTAVTVSVEAPSQNMTVTLNAGSDQTGTIVAGSGRKHVTIVLTSGQTGSTLSVKLKRAAAGSVTFKRVKVEVGYTQSPWQGRNSATELRMCQRYFYRRKAATLLDCIGFMQAYAATAAWGLLYYHPAKMRVAPTLSFSDANALRFWGIGTNDYGITPSTRNGLNTSVDGIFTTNSLTSTAIGLVTAVGAGAGSKIRLTMSSTAVFTTGLQCTVTGVGGSPTADGVWNVTVISGTTLDLDSSTFGSGYASSGGVIVGNTGVGSMTAGHITMIYMWTNAYVDASAEM